MTREEQAIHETKQEIYDIQTQIAQVNDPLKKSNLRSKHKELQIRKMCQIDQIDGR